MKSIIELEDEICPYIMDLPELLKLEMTNTTIKGCSHQPIQATSIKKFRSYRRCPEAGYRNHFRECPLYIGAKKLGARANGG